MTPTASDDGWVGVLRCAMTFTQRSAKSHQDTLRSFMVLKEI